MFDIKTKKFSGYQDLTPVKTKVAEYVRRLKFPEFCLGYIEEHPIPDLQKYRATLLDFLKAKKLCVYPEAVITGLLEKFPRLAKDAELGNALAGKIIELLEIDGRTAPEDEITIDAKPFLRGYLFIYYYFAKALETVLPRKEAIEYFQVMMDANTRTMSLPKSEKVSDLVFSEEEPRGAFKNAFIMTEFVIDEGRSGCRADKCKWAEVMKELNDPDYAYAAACHYDFEAAKMHNPAFTLTRTGTLTQGKPYCDFVWHDTRIDKDPTHPPKEFWDELK
ncbi:MAG: L-2-amino-thiazoline-4-carboxylic acid hydrolase [Elusimicrobia bacterium]|nr:L-2-amino-thiazoline-4-carboxylic acid hydrolase [Elusimicrobiota bacterium]